MSIGFELNIHLRGVMPCAPTWWLRPPPSSSRRVGFSWVSLDFLAFLLFLWKTHSNLSLDWFDSCNLIDWANPPPIMPKASKIISLNIILWYVGHRWALVLNSTYIFAVSCHALQHGGFGHRPLPREELVSHGFHWIFLHFSCSYGKHTQICLWIDLILANLGV